MDTRRISIFEASDCVCFEPFLTVASGNTECVYQPWSSGLVYQSGLGDVTSPHIVNKTHSRDRSCPSSMCWRFSRNKTSKLHSNIRTSERTYIIYILYTGKHYIYVQHDYLRIDLFLQSSRLAITLGGFRAGYPFFKTKHQKKGGSQEGSHPVPNLAGHERCRDRHVSIVPSLCSAGGGNGDLRQIQNKASVMKTWSNSFCMYNIQKYP